MAKPRETQIKSSTAARRTRAFRSKTTRSNAKIPILNVSIVDNHTLWSLDYNVAEHLFKEKLEMIKTRIFLIYGCGNKFIKEYKTWQTERKVAYRIQEDMDWYNEQGFEVKLNF